MSNSSSSSPIKKVGYQGRPGAYSQSAASSFFKTEITTLAFDTFENVFEACVNGEIDYGIIPLENSLAGGILENFDHLLHFNAHICGEIHHRVKHHLMGSKESSLDAVTIIRSHPQALMQCKKNLKKLGNFKVESYFDTAGAVESVAKENAPHVAAIASEFSASLYPVKVLASNIEDNHENYTRFVVISAAAQRPDPSHPIKTSIVYTLKNIPGALFKSLSAFATRDIDLLKIESRPIHGSPFKYQFYVDFAADSLTEPGRNALRHLTEISETLKMLGSYNYNEKSI